MADLASLDEALKRSRARRSLPAPATRRFLRERAGLSQGDLAAALGVTRTAVSLWEGGQRMPRNPGPYLALLQRLAAETR